MLLALSVYVTPRITAQVRIMMEQAEGLSSWGISVNAFSRISSIPEPLSNCYAFVIVFEGSTQNGK